MQCQQRVSIDASIITPTILNWLHDPNSGGSSGGGTSNSINQHDVFSVGANGHLFDSHWKYGGAWSTTDLGTPSGVTLAGSTTSNTFTKNNNLYQHVEVVGNNGHLYELWQPIGGSWGINDLNAIAAPPAGVSFVGSPSGFSYVSSNLTYHSVFVLGSDTHLYWYSYDNTDNWTVTDLTAVVNGPAGVTLTGTPNGNPFAEGSTQYQHVEIVGSNGHLYELFQKMGGTWGLNDLNSLASSTVTVTGSPTGQSYTIQGQSGTPEHHSIFVVTSDGHLQEFYWTHRWYIAGRRARGVQYWDCPLSSLFMKQWFACSPFF